MDEPQVRYARKTWWVSVGTLIAVCIAAVAGSAVWVLDHDQIRRNREATERNAERNEQQDRAITEIDRKVDRSMVLQEQQTRSIQRIEALIETYIRERITAP